MADPAENLDPEQAGVLAPPTPPSIPEGPPARAGSLGPSGAAALGLGKLPEFGFQPTFGATEKPAAAASPYAGFEKRLLGDQAAARKGVEAGYEAALAQSALPEKQARAQADVAKLEADEARRIYADYEAKMEALPLPEAPVTKDNAMQVAGVMAAMTVIGGFLGSGGGQQAALGAVEAMTGMMQGYMQGREDLIQKNQKDFENKYKIIQQKHKLLSEKLNEGFKMLPYNITEGRNKIMNALAAEGSKVGMELAKAGKFKELAQIEAGTTKGMLELAKLNEQVRDRAEARANALLIAQTRGAGKGGAAGSSYVQNFNEQVVNAVGVVAKEISNLKNIPYGGTGWFQGRNTKDFYNAPLGTLINKWTPADTQHLITNMGNLGYSLAKVESGGRAVTQKTIDQFNDQFAIRTGDDPGVVLHKLAQLKQTVLVAIQTRKNSALRTGDMGMYDQLVEYENDFKQNIPFTVGEVLKVFTFDKNMKRSKVRKDVRPDDTFGSYMERTMGGQKPADPPPVKIQIELAPPQAGELRTHSDGSTYRFLGGDPGDKTRWEKLNEIEITTPRAGVQ